MNESLSLLLNIVISIVVGIIFLIIVVLIQRFLINRKVKKLKYRTIITIHLKNKGEIIGVFVEYKKGVITTVLSGMFTKTLVKDIKSINESPIKDKMIADKLISIDFF